MNRFFPFCILVILCAPSLSAQETPISLGSAQPFVLSADQPRAVVAGDFDEDGFLDLASVPAVGNEVSVLINDGSAGFSNNMDFSAAYGSMWGMTTADLDADGHLDLVLCHGLNGNHQVGIWRGLGDGTFVNHATLLAGNFPIDVAAGDFNEDGILDLVVASNVGQSVAIFLGQGGGNFGAATFVSGVSNATSLDVGDIDDDGHLDVVVSSYGGTTAFFGDGQGGFPSLSAAAGGYALTEHACLVDMDQDGDLDVASIEIYTSQLQIRRFEGGTFGALESYTTGGFPRDVFPGDLNRDGIPDLVVIEESTGSARVFRGVGDGTLFSPQTFSVGLAPRCGVLADLDGDGEIDLASGLTQNQQADPQVAVSLNLTVPGPWTYLAPALAGAVGAPLLHGTGSLQPGAPFSLELTHAAPSTVAYLVAGATRADLPVLGGVLIPSPDVLVGTFLTSTAGEVLLSATWPAGVPQGTSFYLQYLIYDAQAPFDYSLSNGLLGLTP